MNITPSPVHTPPPRLSGRNRRRLVGGAIILTAVVGGGIVVAVLSGFLPKSVVAGDPKAKGHEPVAGPGLAIPVRAIQAKLDPSVQLTVEQMATVEAFYQADRRSRVSGLVRSVSKDIGDRVHQGELLIEIDVPDVEQDVAQKEAVVVQRLQELRVSQANLRDAEAGRAVAEATIQEKKALVEQAEATRDFRRKRLARLQRLAASDTVVAGVIDEEERDYRSSEAAVTASKAAVERSRADALEAESRIEAAMADTDLKAALVEVARRDVDRARTIAQFARITATFDGVVVRRNVDPGDFVQNATSGQSEALISIARTDLVTVAARFTEAAAPFITDGTEAEITFDNLPGVTVTGRVTRFSPSLQNNDRTMRVEVDLFNGSEEDRKRLIARLMAAHMAPLAAGDAIGQAVLTLAGKAALTELQKGETDLIPLGAMRSTPMGLKPGMTGTMKLLLREFNGGYVVPSTAVYSRSGAPYILVVENGVTVQKPVRVQINDGRVAKVAFVTRRRDASGVARDQVLELSGEEIIVSGRQLEIGEGQKVQPTVHPW